VGDKILGQTFTKVGVHDSIFETLQTAMGCDSVVMHKVVVKPDPTKLNYYVKTKKAGKGDGSNWENAMDGDDFETYLPLAPDGATFYVAAGTYKPSSGTYNTSASDISIIGGFPADINIGADSKPDKYKTIFSADLKGNDKVSIIRTTDGIDSVTFANREDNASVILSMGNAKNTLSKSRLSGLVFEGATGIAVSLSGDYTVDHCEFKYNKDGLYLQTPLNIDLSKSYFHDNKIAYRKSRNEKTVTNETVDGCTFENNYCSILQSGIERLEVTNSTFYNNGFFEFYEGQNLLLKNNTIVGPYLFNATYTHTSPQTWNLLGNVTKVENYVRDNLFVCREEHPEIGDGSSTNPYKITSASELLWFSKLVSKGTDCQEANPSACAYLSTDIDLSTVCGKNIGNWTPITNFSGTFDGTGHTVSGLYYVSAEEGYVGLFGIIKEGAVVKNVTVSGYLRNGGTIGGVVGAASASTIENCKNLAFVQSTEKFAGGIAGYSNSSTIDRCCNFGTVIDTAGGYAKVGGICAGTSMATTITNCLNAGEITSIARGGGIIGSVDAENTKLSNSFNYGLVVSLGNTRNTDPICGYITQGSACSISNTYSLTQSKNVNVDVLTKEEFADGTLLANLSKNNAGVWTSGSEFPVLVTPMYSKYEGGSRVPEPEPISLLENNLWKYSISSKYNLFNLPSLGENWKYDETDLVYTTEDWSSFMEGSIDSKKFIPKLSYNGGFTPTVALKEDNLPNDTSIRFPLSETTVTEDQRGVSRLPETCMGAYELSKIDTVIVRDTIVLGKTYVFNDKEITPSKIGIYHDTMVVKKDNNEVVQVLNLYVKPYALYNCYVKKVAEGTGDGSSWENAMSAEDFAFALPFAAVGADFYVAEGTYKPIYDELGYETDDSTSLCYRIKNNVSIYGGYPADAKTGATPDPENHPTIFTGDIKGDDKVVKGKDEDGRLELTYVNHDENATQLFLCDGKMMMVSLHDVIVDGASYGIIFTKKDPHLDTDNATFRNCYRAVYCPEGGAVVFTEDTKFENISNYCLYTPNGWNTHISTTSFTGNTGYLVYTNSNMMSMDSVSVRGNNAQIYSTDISEFKISNSEFVDNESTGNLFYMNNIDNTAMFSNVEFVNNKIVQDVIGNYGSNGSRVMTVDNSIFKSNETGSYLINSTDGLIVRHSFVSDNQIASDMFFTYKLTLLSDTFELNKSKYIANPCLSGASIDSCLIKNNDSYLFHSAKSSTDNWRFDLINSDIVDNYKTNLGKDNYVIYTESNMDSVNIARTKFIGNKYEEASFIHNGHSYFDFDECIVDSNYVYNFIYSGQGQINVSNSSFVGNMSRILILCPNSGDAYSFGTGVTLKNNTFVNNIIKESLFDGYYSKSTIVNNTIVGNSSEMYLFGRLLSKNASVIGNILFGNINGQQQAYSGDLNKIAIDIFENNIMALDTSIIDGTVLSETNIISDFSFDEKVKKYTKQDFSKFKNHIDDVVSLFEGTYDATTGLFTPVLKNNGSFTPTVALKSDKLSDGRSIRFPRLENVLTDQRGVERLDSTCMGAYEMKCTGVETVLKDTVMVGDSYTFIDKNLDDVCQKVGSY
ncbi:MAG: right-handed parallel beta-helix repeat-containing protein, partial [Paludibacteraceae bacterium]|nr:right-handed parallel beta-helix repeat-containing protein [Paludibacteraceae bacterium]